MIGTYCSCIVKQIVELECRVIPWFQIQSRILELFFYSKFKVKQNRYKNETHLTCIQLTIDASLADPRELKERPLKIKNGRVSGWVLLGIASRLVAVIHPPGVRGEGRLSMSTPHYHPASEALLRARKCWLWKCSVQKDGTVEF